MNIKTITSALIFCLMTGLLSAQNISNGDFEDWSNTFLTDEFPPYHTTAAFSYIETGASNIKAVTAPGGTAIRMETVDGESYDIAGFVHLGDGDNDFANSGLPYSEAPDSVRFRYRHNIMAGDTGILGVLFKEGPTSVGGLWEEINGNTNGWVDTTIACFYITAMPNVDTVMVALASSNPGGSGIGLGSFLEVDEISFIGATQQLPNWDFEATSVLETPEPDSWTTPNQFTTLFGATPSLTQSTNASSGSSALRIETIQFDFDGNTDTTGFVTNGDIDLTGGKPISGKPTSYEFDYQYTPVGQDTAIALITFKAGGQEIASFGKKLTMTSGGYQHVVIDTDLSSVGDPDTVLIAFASSDWDQFMTQATVGIGSALLVDNLIFKDAVNSLYPQFHENLNLKVFPSLTQGPVNLSWEAPNSASWKLNAYDLQGRLLPPHAEGRSMEGSEVSTSIDLSGLPAGAYLLRLIDSKGHLLATSKVLLQF